MANNIQVPLGEAVQSGAPGVKGCDTNTIILEATAEKLVQEGYSFCVRYFSHQNKQRLNDLSYNEANFILKAGLSLIMAVQHVLNAGWKPTATLGSLHGVNVASNASSIGLPGGMNIWCDLEGVADGTSP
jgi:hypothetical protein